MNISESIHDAIALVDVDGTVSSTPQHMAGLNERLAADFPAIGERLEEIKAQRAAFRDSYGHLSFAEQDEIWQSLYPGTTSHSQLDIYRTFAPDIFDTQTTAEVKEWLSDPENFGYAEYDDVRPMFEGLRRIGSPAVLFTLGQYETSDGEPGWQQLKIKSSPLLRSLPSHITETLPPEGKGTVICQAYNQKEGLFRFPLTDGGESITTRSIVMVDDSAHNMRLPGAAMGILIDRGGKKANWQAPSNVHVVRSLEEVPVLIEEYAVLRRDI
ncbi:MAG TPA: hypothetical protein VJ836_06160 [Candidatus Saccharimonadales bacterium]|nr:hypothetical protein [Candidatus Saccharimonadales bacterium]